MTPAGLQEKAKTADSGRISGFLQKREEKENENVYMHGINPKTLRLSAGMLPLP